MLDTLSKSGAIFSGPRDTVLLHPRLLVVRDDRIIVFDQGRYAIEAFSREGQLRWVAGRRGAGPAEFAQPTGMSVGPDGEIAVIDIGNRRVSRLSSNGTFLESVPLADSLGLVDRAINLGGGTFLLARTREPVLLEVDSDGNVLRTARHPWPGYDDLHGLASQFLLLGVASGGVALMPYYGGGFSVLDSSLATRVTMAPYVEEIAFPEVQIEVSGNRRTESVEGATRALYGAAANDTMLAVLALGNTEMAGRVIDLYRLKNGAYIGSWLLPEVARDIALAGDTVIVVTLDPVPGLIFYTTH